MKALSASLAFLICGFADVAYGASWTTTGRSEYWVDEYGYSYTNQCAPPYSGTGQPPCPTDAARGWVQNSDAALGNIYQQIGSCNTRQNGECGGFAYATGGVASQGQVAGSCSVVGAFAVNVDYRRYMYYLGSCSPSLPPDPATCPNDAVEGASYQAIELQCR